MGKIVVKKVQSQNSTVAFQLPATDGSANQIMKTDGSANLGWTEQNTFKSADGSSLEYIPPTNTASGNLVNNNTSSPIQLAYASGGNPMNSPDGNHQGWRIFDKYNFNNGGDNPGSANAVNLICPTSYTTTASNIIAMRLEFYGVSINNNSKTPIPHCRPIDQAGNFVANTQSTSGNAVSWFIPGQGSGAKFFNPSTSDTNSKGFAQGTNSNRSGTLGMTDYTSSSSKKSYSSYNYRGGGLMLQMNWYNAYAYPAAIGHHTGAYSMSNSNNGWNLTTMRNYGDYSFHNSTAQHAMGFSVRDDGGNSLNNGCIVLSGFFKDGVVS